VAVLVFLAVTNARGDDASSLERQVKAAFLYKFGDYVEWPAGTFATADAPLVIGVMADDELAHDVVLVTAGRRIQGHPVEVREVREGDDFSTLDALFIAGAGRARVQSIINALPHQPVLIVTECPGGLDAGGMINFRIVDGHVRFEVALDHADGRGIRLSSRLLTVALRVEGVGS